MLRAADQGDLATFVQTLREIEGRDPTLAGLLQTRRAAVSGIEWSIVDASSVSKTPTDESSAMRARDHVLDVLGNLESFESFIRHLGSAIGPGIAVAEIEWQGNTLVGLHPVDASRLRWDMPTSQLRIKVDESDWEGIPAEPGKFIVHMPHAQGKYPQQGPVLRNLLLTTIAKAIVHKQWIIYSQVFGMPVRVGKVPITATDRQRDDLLEELKGMSSNAVAVLNDDESIELANVDSRGNSPYEPYIRWCDERMAIAILGQTLTTEVGEAGSRAAAQVHNLIRRDILKADIEREAETIRRQLFKWIIKWTHTESEAPVPYWCREIPRDVNRLAEADGLRRAQDVGLDVPADWAYEALAIPKPAEGDDVLAPVVAPVPTFGFGAGPDDGTEPNDE